VRVYDPVGSYIRETQIDVDVDGYIP
jgi:hypothetical protein